MVDEIKEKKTIVREQTTNKTVSGIQFALNIII